MKPEDILGFTLGLFALGALAIHRSSRSLDSSTRRKRWVKYVGYFLIVHLFIASALAGSTYVTLLVASVGILGAFELFRVCCKHNVPRCGAVGVFIIFSAYLALTYSLIRFSQLASTNEIIFVYLVTASLDGFSQVTGQWIGRTRLAPRISPNKTLEGAFGGLAGAILTALVLRSLLGLSIWQTPLLGFLLAAAGLTGDLLASYVKRRNQVKDFGRILPEHGGVLDRFDSLLWTAPAFALWRG